MALVSLLLALLIERILHLSPRFQLDELLQYYLYPRLPSFTGKGYIGTFTVLAMPTIVIYGLIDSGAGVFYGLLTMLAWLIVLLMSFGGTGHRQNYRKYLTALSEKDIPTKDKLAYSFDVDSDKCCPSKLTQEVANQLVWINYRFYFAVIFYFVLLGPIGTIFYVAARSFYQYINTNNQSDITDFAITRMMYLMDWIPSRLTMLGFALVSDGNSALPQSLRAWLDFKTPASELLANVTNIATAKHQDMLECYGHTCYQVQLAKRNIILYMTVISLLTINGTLI